jgi:hypothetical protein
VHRENPLNEGDEEIKKERTGFFFCRLGYARREGGGKIPPPNKGYWP